MRAHLIAWLMLSAVAACVPVVDPGNGSGEDGWMLGTWSNRAEAVGADSVAYLEVLDDGVLTQRHLGSCGANEGDVSEYRWRAHGADEIEVTDVDGTPMDSRDDPTYYVLRDVCDAANESEGLDFVVRRGGEEVFRAQEYIRGTMCLEELPPPQDPDAGESDYCQAIWCDGEPPATLPCLP